MRRVADAYRRAGVRAIILVHGTFVGADALGLLRGVARFAPDAADSMRRIQKLTLDKIASDAGNFTVEYGDEFERALAEGDRPSIPLKRFCWSSENYHVGRADGAVRLLDELASSELEGDRVLLWGHSHGGNLLALVTNLLANDGVMNNRFFRASRTHYRATGRAAEEMQAWKRVRSRLKRRDCPLRDLNLDLVTLGTPVRYGWDVDGFSHLLHFVNHRPHEGLPEHQAYFPPTPEDVLHAAYGDYVQQLGIAGTNTTPAIWAWRDWLAELRLRRILQSRIRSRDLLSRLKLGVRVHADGKTLLVDYGPDTGFLGEHLAGHAVYTRLNWLLFHAEQVAIHFYGLTNAS